MLLQKFKNLHTLLFASYSNQRSKLDAIQDNSCCHSANKCCYHIIILLLLFTKLFYYFKIAAPTNPTITPIANAVAIFVSSFFL